MGHTTFFDSQRGLFLFRSSETFSECCIVECKRNLIFSSLQLAKTSATANSNFDASSVYSFSGIYRTTSQEAFNLLEALNSKICLKKSGFSINKQTYEMMFFQSGSRAEKTRHSRKAHV